jgi:Tol biopolymer transport system component
MTLIRVILYVIVLPLLFGCKEPVSPPPPRLEPTITSVSVTPPAIEIIVNGCQQFLAEVKGTNGFDTTVTWSLEGMGTLSADGQYCAPALECSALVIARSKVDTTKVDTAYVTVRYGIIAVSVTPETAELDFGETLQFTATVSGTNQNTSGSWSVQYGTITSSGFYTAPNSPVEDKVVFTSSVDPTKADTSYVTVKKFGWIVFANWDNFAPPPYLHTYDIGVVRLDGSKFKKLTLSPNNDFHPEWSPNGMQIAFDRDGQGTNENLHIVVMNADGSNQKRVAYSDTMKAFQPAWSPNGMRFAFTFVGSEQAGIATMSTGGMDFAIVYSVPCRGGICAVPMYPDWSPDGSQIVFSFHGGINVINVDGENLRTFGSDVANHPKWSPDGTKIAFWNNEGVYAINADGSGLKLLAAGAKTPNWSPDGSQIAYVDTATIEYPLNLGLGIYVMDVDGTNKRLVWKKDRNYPLGVAWKP